MMCCGGVCVCWVGGSVTDTSLALARVCCILYVMLVCISVSGTSTLSYFKIKCLILLSGSVLGFLLVYDKV